MTTTIDQVMTFANENMTDELWLAVVQAMTSHHYYSCASVQSFNDLDAVIYNGRVVMLIDVLGYSDSSEMLLSVLDKDRQSNKLFFEQQWTDSVYQETIIAQLNFIINDVLDYVIEVDTDTLQEMIKSLNDEIAPTSWDDIEYYTTLLNKKVKANTVLRTILNMLQ